MASRLVPGRPAIVAVVEHICELDKKLKSETVSIGEEVSCHLKKMSATLTELEASRRAAHERLEVESIRTSKLRLQAARLGEHIAGEIAVRNTNVDLTVAEIQGTAQDIEYMEKRTEREFMNRSHEDAIKQPDYHRSQKASKQLFIDDTNKKIQSLRKQIGQVKKAQQDLKDCMVQIRCKFTERKQTFANSQIAHIEESMSRLDNVIQNQDRQLVELETEEQQLASLKDFHNKELAELRRAFEKSLVLQEQVKVKREAVDAHGLNQALANTMELFNTQKKAEEESRKTHLNMTRQITTNPWNPNVDELEDQLDQEEREAVLSHIDVIWRSLEDLHQAGEEHEREVTEAIKSKSKKQADRQEEEHQVIKPLKEDLSKTLEMAEEQYIGMQASCTATIEELTREAESVEEKLVKKEQELKVQESILKEMEVALDMEQATCQRWKSHLEELNSKRSQLEEAVQQLEEKTEAILKPKEDLKQKIERLNAQHVQLLRSQALEISTMEKGSYENILMLEQVNLENSRLRSNIQQMKADICNTNKEKERQEREAVHLWQELRSLHKCVLDAWKTDLLITEEHAETNQTILQAISQVGSAVQKRKHKVEVLSDKLRVQAEGAASLLSRTAGKPDAWPI